MSKRALMWQTIFWLAVALAAGGGLLWSSGMFPRLANWAQAAVVPVWAATQSEAAGQPGDGGLAGDSPALFGQEGGAAVMPSPPDAGAAAPGLAEPEAEPLEPAGPAPKEPATAGPHRPQPGEEPPSPDKPAGIKPGPPAPEAAQEPDTPDPPGPLPAAGKPTPKTAAVHADRAAPRPLTR